MKLYRLMVSILCMALLMVLWGCFPCVAEILVRDGHVTGGKDIDGKSFTYDFALPAEIKHPLQKRANERQVIVPATAGDGGASLPAA